MTDTRSTCPYCGVGCGVIIESESTADGAARITGVRGDPDHPANFGRLCSKGSTLHLTATAPVLLHERLRHPMQRLERGSAPKRTGWGAAQDLVARRIADAVQSRGPQSVGFYLSGQLLTEDYAVFNKLARGLVGTNNVDTNSRLCMSSAVVGYKQSLGADAPPACYDDLDHAGCLFIAGSNMAWAHPVLYRRVEDARAANPLLKTIVVDPRRTDTAAEADLHLALQPGTDVALFHAMLHVMVWEGWLDADHIAAHTQGFTELKSLVAGWTPREAARVTGVKADQIEQAARWFAWGGNAPPSTTPAARRAGTLSLYCQGLNQSTSGTAKNSTLINLHLATGQIGRVGAGPFSLTGQPNAMGGRESGGMATVLPGHRDPNNSQHRDEVAAVWGVPSLPSTPGLTAVPMFEAAARGDIDVLWIVCTNPAMSLPDQTLVRAALQRCPFVIVQEAFATTETAAYADLLLPGATWGEKDGTVTNSERRISRARAAVAPVGEARPDWQIAAQVAERLERLLQPSSMGPKPTSRFAYADAEAVWNEHRATTIGRDLDIGGLSWPMLDELGPQQWPLPVGASTGRARLYENGVYATDNGKARFIAAPYKAVAESTDARHPFSLTTGRLRDQWHGMSRTGTVATLFSHSPQPTVQLHPQDMLRRGLKPGDLAELRTKRGSLVLPVEADAGLLPLQAHVAMHWGARFVNGRDAQGRERGGINTLTHGKSCAQSHQPELKHAAVAITRAELPWRLSAAAWLTPDAAAVARETLVGLMGAFAHARCVPVRMPATAPPAAPAVALGSPAAALPASTDRIGIEFHAAAHEAADDALIERIEQALGLTGAWVLRYADARRGRRRSVLLGGPRDDARVDALLLAGPADAATWLLPRWAAATPLGAAAVVARALLLPDPPPVGGLATVAVSREVCNCFRISEERVRETLSTLTGTPSERLAGLQSRLSCGTQCGSCKPELRRLVAATLPASIAAPATLVTSHPSVGTPNPREEINA